MYVIYYAGPFVPYAPISIENKEGNFVAPVYIGKAIPKGGRKGGLATDLSGRGRALADRLRQHADSIKQTRNLQIEHFHVRYLLVDDIWIPLGENVLIENFKPVWNQVIDGFGNKDPGRRRATQYKSPWDVLHPGRHFAEKLADSGLTSELLITRTGDHFAGRPLTKLPKVIAEQQEAEKAAAEEGADEV